MESASVLGLDIATSVRVFGHGPASFLSRLNPDHPDLSAGSFADFFARASQTARCASFCIDEGLSFPLEALSSSFPRSHPSFFSAVRLLDRRGREEARARKSCAWVDFCSLASDPIVPSPDLPSSFGRFKGEVSVESDWQAMEFDFRSVGCFSMAAAAALVSSEFSKDDLGLCSLSMKRAFLILGRRLGVWNSGRTWFPIAAPACSVSLPEWASASIEASESSMMGHPLFDHHVVLAFVEDRDPPVSLYEGIVILGERDGRFHFLDSD